MRQHDTSKRTAVWPTSSVVAAPQATVRECHMSGFLANA